jgi:hypothetical protein
MTMARPPISDNSTSPESPVELDNAMPSSVESAGVPAHDEEVEAIRFSDVISGQFD